MVLNVQSSKLAAPVFQAMNGSFNLIFPTPFGDSLQAQRLIDAI
jgi:hypothetical protein